MSITEPCDICKTRDSQGINIYLPGFRHFSHYANVCDVCWGVRDSFAEKWDQFRAQYVEDRKDLEDKTQKARTSILEQWKDASVDR